MDLKAGNLLADAINFSKIKSLSVIKMLPTNLKAGNQLADAIKSISGQEGDPIKG
jgi:hypothetical protein